METNLDYRKRVLDSISASFCGAKWYNATIWLGSGMTTSCHHPPAHKVDASKLANNPRLLHNTEEKKDDRRKMLSGERPAGCEYCWKIEDMGRNSISDRVYKSKIYRDADLIKVTHLPAENDFNLKTLEIAFDRTCNLACSYCNPAFSTTWVKDIRNNGGYENLISDGRNHFTHKHDSAQLYKPAETNPYVEAFFEWWESDLHRTLQELRITGGEPLMSGHTWKLMDWFAENQSKSNTQLAINSNLSIPEEKIQEFIAKARGVKTLDVYTSNEAVGIQAEYIRDGLDWDLWNCNMLALLESDNIRAVHSMCTINALCLESLPEYLDHLVALKEKYSKDKVNFTLNILRFPSFQSALVLPAEIKTKHRQQLIDWKTKHQDHPEMHEHELQHLDRLIEYLQVVETPHSETSFDKTKLQHDFKHFYAQYDRRRGKNFSEAFPRLKDWYNGL